jgi:putative membrane protein
MSSGDDDAASEDVFCDSCVWYQMWKAQPQLTRVGRVWAFMSGLLLVAGIVATPLANIDHHSLTGHMVQHLVLMTLAAPLILVGTPGIVWRRRSPFCLTHRLSVRYGQGAAAAGDRRYDWQATVGWCAGTACVIWWHIPSVFEWSMRSGRWHALEQVTFLLAGLLFWRPVIQPWSSTVAGQWSIPVYLFLATLPCDALAAFLTFCGRAVYPTYMNGPAGASAALLDQEVAGSMMWVWVTFVYLLPAVVITIQGLSCHEPTIDLEVAPPNANAISRQLSLAKQSKRRLRHQHPVQG